jgi:heavy metal sensor kinase
LWTSGLLLAILILFGVYLYTSLARGLTGAMDESLALYAAQVVAEVDIENGQLQLSPGFEDEPEIANLRARGVTIRILDAGGDTLHESGLLRGFPEASRLPYATVVDPGSERTIRLHTFPVEADNRVVAIVQVAQAMDEVEDTLQRLLITLWVSVPLLVGVAGLGGYLLAGRALEPVDRITRTARRISAEGLSERLNLPATGDEAGRLASTFDEMLARLDESFQRERQFTADASHELRTPLTAMQAILGVTRERRRSPKEYERALADLAEETDRLRTLAEDLLRVARGQDRARQETVDLSTLLNDVAASLHPLAERKGLTLTSMVPQGLTLRGDRDELIRMFVNLVGNAIQYTEHGGVTLSTSKNQVPNLSVSVADTGVGIAPEHLPHVFGRFYRVDKSRPMRGAGLGLAIAQTIARSHGGTIEVRSESGKGTTFTVHLPVDSRPG